MTDPEDLSAYLDDDAPESSHPADAVAFAPPTRATDDPAEDSAGPQLFLDLAQARAVRKAALRR